VDKSASIPVLLMRVVRSREAMLVDEYSKTGILDGQRVAADASSSEKEPAPYRGNTSALRRMNPALVARRG